MACHPNLRLDPGSIKGRGADILLPGRGSPFKPGESSQQRAAAALVASWSEPPVMPEAEPEATAAEPAAPEAEPAVPAPPPEAPEPDLAAIEQAFAAAPDFSATSDFEASKSDTVSFALEPEAEPLPPVEPLALAVPADHAWPIQLSAADLVALSAPTATEPEATESAAVDFGLVPEALPPADVEASALTSDTLLPIEAEPTAVETMPEFGVVVESEAPALQPAALPNEVQTIVASALALEPQPINSEDIQPDWRAELAPTAEAAAPATAPLIAPATAAQPSEVQALAEAALAFETQRTDLETSLPDWLTEIAPPTAAALPPEMPPVQVVAESGIEPEPQPLNSATSLPDWLAEFTPASAAALPAEPPPAPVVAPLGDMLASQPAEAEGFMPDWLTEIAPVTETALPATPPVVQVVEESTEPPLPDWLTELAPITEAPLPEAVQPAPVVSDITSALAAQPAEIEPPLPDWLAELAPAAEAPLSTAATPALALPLPAAAIEPVPETAEVVEPPIVFEPPTENSSPTPGNTWAMLRQRAETDSATDWDAALLTPSSPLVPAVSAPTEVEVVPVSVSVGGVATAAPPAADIFPPIARETFALSGPLPSRATPAKRPATQSATALSADEFGGVAKAGGAEEVAPSLIPEPHSPQTLPYQRPPDQAADAALVQFFVDDATLKNLWQVIDAWEAEVTKLQVGGSQLKSEALERLRVARNLLMSNRAHYEDARREVAEVKILVTRLQQTAFLAQPLVIVMYVLVLTVVVCSGLLLSLRIDIGNVFVQLSGFTPTATDWLRAILFGMLGGLTVAFFNLMRHVTDYDPQYARWYYLSPILGLLFGPVVVLLFQLGLPVMIATTAAVSPSDLTLNPWMMYLLAWLVGFQHNLLLRFLNAALKNVLPKTPESDEKGGKQPA